MATTCDACGEATEVLTGLLLMTSYGPAGQGLESYEPGAACAECRDEHPRLFLERTTVEGRADESGQDVTTSAARLRGVRAIGRWQATRLAIGWSVRSAWSWVAARAA